MSLERTSDTRPIKDTTPEGPAQPDKSTHAASIGIEDLLISFDTRRGTVDAVHDVNLFIPAGEFTAIVGPSGCGKSTILNAIAGLRKPQQGTVRLDGEVVRKVSKSVGYLFQKDALLPWKTVLRNVALPLIIRGVPRKEAHERAREWLSRVRLDGFEDYYPHQLSGGMKKRVALAAVFVYEPTVMLMDEPFSALDVQTRNLMENELLDLWTVSRPTVVFVTHDLEEAIGLSDRVVVFSAGPGTVKCEYQIDLPRPRSLTEIRFAEGFDAQYENIWGDLRSEVLAAYAQQQALKSSKAVKSGKSGSADGSS
jgi:NitT/TauT family transport system ATP-binding protein